MQFRPELERLATLGATDVTAAEINPSIIVELVDDAHDESLDLDERADEADLRGDTDHAAYLRQEAAAWRATIVLLRQMAAAHEEAASVVVAGRGVA